MVFFELHGFVDLKYIIVTLFDIVPQYWMLCSIFFFFSLFSSPLFQSGELLLIYLQFQWFSPWLFQVYWLACQRYSSSLLLHTLSLALLFIFIVSISQLKVTIWSCILFTFSTRIFNIKIIIILNCLLAPTSVSYLSLVLLFCLSRDKTFKRMCYLFLPFHMHYSVLLRAEHLVWMVETKVVLMLGNGHFFPSVRPLVWGLC